MVLIPVYFLNCKCIGNFEALVSKIVLESILSLSFNANNDAFVWIFSPEHISAAVLKLTSIYRFWLSVIGLFSAIFVAMTVIYNFYKLVV